MNTTPIGVWPIAVGIAIFALAIGRETTSRAAPSPPPSVPAAPPPASTGGYWLSVELAGDPAATTAALAALGQPAENERTPTDAGPPGSLVGSAADITTAMGWVARNAFAATTGGHEPARLAKLAAPVPGGPVLDAHGVYVRALIVSGATPQGGLRPIAWPTEQHSVIPAESGWVPAALATVRAPLFAAPGPHVPPAAERHAMVTRSGGLFILGWLDRCDTEGDQCLRWCQVVARNGDRFVAGYLPAYLVTRQDRWVRGAAALPRAQLIRSGTRNKSAQLLLIARDRHGTLHRKRIAVPLDSGQFPTTTLRVEGDWALVGVGETEPLKIALDGSMDVRHR